MAENIDAYFRGMNAALLKSITQAIYADENVAVPTVQSLSGGDINQAAKISFGKESFFVKWNSASVFPRMFELEANGLKTLAESGLIKIPKVVATSYADDNAFLILEFIESGSKPSNFWSAFGEQLANLHKQSHKLFGFEEDNYIGSLFQSNGQLRSWADFYIINRLDLQLEMAFNDGKMHQSISRLFNKLYPKLEALIPEEQPALIHGDLWSGNYLVGPNGEPVLIDPAVYYGHREMDLGMMQLFGGFAPEMFRAYDRAFPLQPGWQERIPIHQLYPLLVHVNLFGGGYVNQVESILRRFT